MQMEKLFFKGFGKMTNNTNDHDKIYYNYNKLLRVPQGLISLSKINFLFVISYDSCLFCFLYLYWENEEGTFSSRNVLFGSSLFTFKLLYLSSSFIFSGLRFKLNL